jgi:tetratricopeptide (TPR) repeat protein
VGEADREFFETLSWAGFDIEFDDVRNISPSQAGDPHDERIKAILERVQGREISVDEIRDEIDWLLANGDSWSAIEVAQRLDAQVEVPDPRLATSMALAYALQENNDDAERLFRLWEDAGGLEAARARYSLAMMYARHHSAQRRDNSKAADLLQTAYELLCNLPETEAIRLEKVFNRNGYALLLFRQGNFAEAAGLLEAGIRTLHGTKWEGQLHETVLLNNLGRVYAGMQRLEDAEASLRKAVELDQLFAEYHQDLASLLVDVGDLVGAKESIEAATSLDPAIVEVHELHGYICEKLADMELAIACYRTAFSLGSPSAGLAMLRALSAIDRNSKILSLVPEVMAAQASEDDLVECRLIAIESESSIADVDLLQSLQALQMEFPGNELIAENIMLAK